MNKASFFSVLVQVPQKIEPKVKVYVGYALACENKSREKGNGIGKQREQILATFTELATTY